MQDILQDQVALDISGDQVNMHTHPEVDREAHAHAHASTNAYVRGEFAGACRSGASASVGSTQRASSERAPSNLIWNLLEFLGISLEFY